MSHPTSGLTAVGGNWTPMLSLQLPVSFLSPGRFFPPQHMVGPTVLTYLLSHRISHSCDPLLLTRSLPPLSPFLFQLLDLDPDGGGASRRAARWRPDGGAGEAAWWGGMAGRRRRWRRGAEVAQQVDGVEEAPPSGCFFLFF